MSSGGVFAFRPNPRPKGPKGALVRLRGNAGNGRRRSERRKETGPRVPRSLPVGRPPPDQITDTLRAGYRTAELSDSPPRASRYASGAGLPSFPWGALLLPACLGSPAGRCAAGPGTARQARRVWPRARRSAGERPCSTDWRALAAEAASERQSIAFAGMFPPAQRKSAPRPRSRPARPPGRVRWRRPHPHTWTLAAERRPSSRRA